jgi:hypothetical protein
LDHREGREEYAKRFHASRIARSAMENQLVSAIVSNLNQEPSFEHKFLFARCNHARVIGMLGYWLAPDPEFRAGRITSIYYDTPTLDLYHEKRASTFLKTKVRLRWYGAVTRANGDVKCYLEVKRKIGGTRQKQRLSVQVPAVTLAKLDLDARMLTRLPGLLPTLGHSLSGALMPMLVVQYQRQRFVHPNTGARVAVDIDICCPAVNRRFVPGFAPAFVDACVLEIKGSERELPEWLMPLRQYVRKDAFSKYASCFEHLLQPAGRRE